MNGPGHNSPKDAGPARYKGEIRPDQLFIHPDECIDCGACEPVCPVKAIFTEDETPEPWKRFIDLNKQFFKDNPGVQACTTRT